MYNPNDPEFSPEGESRLAEIRNHVASLPVRRASYEEENCTPDPARDLDICTVQMTAEEADAVNRNTVFDALSREGIRLVAGTFDGYDDSGQIDELLAVVGDQLVEIPTLSVPCLIIPNPGQAVGSRRMMDLRRAIEMLIYEHLDEFCPGWEIGMGGEGDFYVDVVNRQILGQLFARGDDDDDRPCTF